MVSSSPKWFNYPHLRALPGPPVVPRPTQPYSLKMFKPLFIKFAPVVLMLLLTLAVKCYSRILNWHPLLHVKKTAMKPESLADTLSAASQGGHPLNTRPLLPAQDKVGCCRDSLYSHSPIASPQAAGFAFGMSGSCTSGPSPSWRQWEPQGIPVLWAASAGAWELAWPTQGSLFLLLLCANNYRCNLSDLSVLIWRHN